MANAVFAGIWGVLTVLIFFWGGLFTTARQSRIPGPAIAKFSPLFLYIICYLGVEGRVTRYYHRKYNTKVLRVAPNHMSISDIDAIRTIYTSLGGFAKDARYLNFDIGPTKSIFSATDQSYRDIRAKAVAPLFAPVRFQADKGPGDLMRNYVHEFLEHLQEARDKVGTVDLFDACARLSIDVVTGCLLGERYGGLTEIHDLDATEKMNAKLSANPFIMSIVAFSRFSLLPKWSFKPLYALFSRLNTNEHVTSSFIKLNQYIERIMQIGSGKMETYQGRLIDSGVSAAETAVQSSAIIFAGGDSTAVMLATIIFHLTKNQKIRARLLQEIQDSNASRPGAVKDPQSLPYLRAVVKEGLRLGMANPTRLTRVVPKTGLRVGEFDIEPGTIVGCAAYVLHHDPETFPDPFSFRPERWLGESRTTDLEHRKMEQAVIPFGVGSRACIGRNLAQAQIYHAVLALVDSQILDNASTVQDKINMVEWFNGDIAGHHLDIEWHGLGNSLN